MPAGRPPSLDRIAMLERLADAPPGGMTVTDLARALGLARGRAADAMHRLVTGGQAVEVRRVALPGIKKPVCHYGLPPPEEPPLSIFSLLQSGLCEGKRS